MKTPIDAEKCKKHAVDLARALIRCREVLDNNLQDMEENDLTKDPLYKFTAECVGEADYWILQVHK